MNSENAIFSKIFQQTCKEQIPTHNKTNYIHSIFSLIHEDRLLFRNCLIAFPFWTLDIIRVCSFLNLLIRHFVLATCKKTREFDIFWELHATFA